MLEELILFAEMHDAVRKSIDEICRLEGIDVVGFEMPEVHDRVREKGLKLLVTNAGEKGMGVTLLKRNGPGLKDTTVMQMARITFEQSESEITITASHLNEEGIALINKDYEEWVEDK